MTEQLTGTAASIQRRLADAGGVIFDIDGCLILSSQPAGHDGAALPHSLEAVKAIRASGRRVMAFTNASSRTPDEIARSLSELGFGFSGAEVLTPSVIAAELIRERYHDAPVLAFGGPGLVDVLSAQGVVLADPSDPGEVAVVVLGWDVDFDQKKLQCAAEAVWGGAPIMVTSDARSFAAKEGRKNAGLGGFIANGLSYVTRTGYEVVGKPSLAALSVAARLLRVEADRILIAGDDLTLEVAMAVRGGGVGVLVTTGTHSREDAAIADVSCRPDLVVDHLGELADAIRLADQKPSA